jgi:probable O-glycosylation ligase (exosortase A-associated)
MRDQFFILTMLLLLPMAVLRPFVGVLLWSWISFMNPHQLLWGEASGLPWAAVIFAATLVGCVLGGEPRRFAFNLVNVIAIALLLAFTLTTATALAPVGAQEKWQAVTKMGVMLLLTSALLTERARIHALVWMLVIALGYYGVKGGGFTLMTGGSQRVWGPPNTMIFDNNHLAAALLVALPMMNWLRLQSAHLLVRLGLLPAMGLTMLAAIGSQSRGALLGLAACTAVFWLHSRHKLAMGVVLGLAGLGILGFMPDSWTNRMNTIGTYQEDRSATERLDLWIISTQLALDRPLVGAGFTGAYNQAVVDRVAPGGPARAVHSIWFELLGEHGFPTFALWVSFLLAGLWTAWRLPRLVRDRPDLEWAADFGRMAQVSIVGFIVAGTFLSLSYWDVLWTLLICVGATRCIVQQALVAAPETLLSGWRRRAALRLQQLARAARARPAAGPAMARRAGQANGRPAAVAGETGGGA